MKKLLLAAIVFFQILIFAQTAIEPAFISGKYQIASLENLYWIAAPDSVVPVPDSAARWSSHYVQINDISASETYTWFPDGQGGYSGWLPIASGGFFSGTYDGSLLKIDSLYLNRDFNGGFFSDLIGSYVCGVRLTNISCRSTQNAGGIAVQILNGSVVEKCSVSGSVSASGYTGGISGYIDNSYISECSVSGTVSSTEFSAGGITANLNNSAAGEPYACSVTNCYSTASVSGFTRTGGLIGFCGGVYIEVTYCYSSGSVTCQDTLVGGLVWNSYLSVFSGCFWDIETSGQTTSGAGTGKTTFQMKTQSTFTNWDFSTPIWRMTETVTNPFLAWQPSANVVIVNSDNGVDGEYPAGFVLNLQPYVYPPGSGMYFLNWTDGDNNILSEDQSLVYTVTDQDVTITANFDSGTSFLVLSISHDNTNVILDWDHLAGATYYRIFSTDKPYGTFTLDETGTFDGTSWTAPFNGNKRFYYIVGYN